MIYYPVYLDLKNRRCVLIGGGTVGYRKAVKLIEAGADLIIISPELCQELTVLLCNKKFTHINRRYHKGDLDNAFIAIVATNDAKLNANISRDAKCPINSVDMPKYCSFILPSIIEKGHLNISVSTSGVSPSLSRTLRLEIEDFIDTKYSDNLESYLMFLKDFRNRIFSLKEIKKKRESILKFAGSKEALIILKEQGITAIKDRLNGLLDSLFDQTLK